MRSIQAKYNYHKGNYAEIQKGLLEIDWNQRWKDKSLNEMWEDLSQLIMEQVALHIPLKKPYVKRKERLSKRTYRLIKKRSKAWKRYGLYQSGRNWNEYKKLRNEVNQSIRREEKLNRKRILKSFKGQPKRFYGFMRNLQSVKDQVTVLKKQNGQMTTSDQEVADLFSGHFKEVYTAEDLSNVPTASESNVKGIDPVSFSQDVVFAKLRNLKTDKSPGPDGLHPLLLRECSSVIAEPLSKIFTLSYDTGLLPNEWKMAHVVPIFKKGDRTQCGNYRPVSLTSIPCKVMESIIKDVLLKHLETNNLLCKQQNGF